jgi:hypothetical protein
MNDTLSQLYNACFSSLGMPSTEILSRIELAQIVMRRLSFRLEQVRQSEQGTQMSVTPVEFTLAQNEDEVVLTDLVSDFVIPLWAEYKSWTYLTNPIWVYLPVVNLSTLQEKRAMWQYCCSFFGNNARDVRIKTSLFGNEATLMNPYAATIKVYYSQDIPFPDTEQSTIDLPNNLVNMVMFDSMVAAVAVMQTNAAKYVIDRPQLAPQITAWEGLRAQYIREQAEFESVFLKWCNESRGSHRPTMREDVLTNVIGNRAGMGTNVWINNN